MKKRIITPRKQLNRVVRGPDDDGSRSIEKLQREIRRLTAMNASKTDLLKQWEAMSDYRR